MANSQLDKQRRNEEKANIFRDSKRRIVYPIDYTEQAYVLSQDTMGRVMLYDARIAFALMPIALIFGLMGKYLLFSVFIGLLLYSTLTIYFTKYFLPRHRIIKLKPEDYAHTISLDVLKMKRQERIIRALMGIVVLVLILNFTIAMYYRGEQDTLQLISSGISLCAASFVLGIEVKDILKLSKLIKVQKK